jgi:TatD DNase family protein
LLAPDLPLLDCHAHIAPDVTTAQISGLDGAYVFAVTRSPAEAQYAASRRDATLTWGFGVHPAVPDALPQLTPERLSQATTQHVLIGEVGLDRRGPLSEQTRALETILTGCRDKPVLLSLHSTGRTRQILDVLAQQSHPGAILHWFNGTPDEIAQAVELGCYFSVNNAMTVERLAQIPRRLMLPETDFPASRRTTLAGKPGDVRALEQSLARRDSTDIATIRAGWYRNLGRIAAAAGAVGRLSDGLQNAIVAASNLKA